jgi:Putative DNA-binding domain
MRTAEFEQFARALCDPTLASPPGLHSATGAALDERFAVYRNNVFASLVSALCENFPVTLTLVGDEFFRAMARAYVHARKPSSEQLHGYGKDLPKFIAAFPPASALPYLSDVAAVETAWSESWAAQDMPAVPLATLVALPVAALAAARVSPHAATRIVRSDWPVGSIWQAHQVEHPELSDITWLPETVLITRRAATIHLQLLPAGPAIFAEQLLFRGQTIEAAAAATNICSPTLDVGRALGELIVSGAITEILAP